MPRPYNFSPGPALLPLPVLQRAREELLDWGGGGISVLEMSHRGKRFAGIAEQAEADLRELLGIPDDYRVLFLQGGASAQFAMVPLNLLGQQQQVDYVNTGHWSQRAIAEAGKYAKVNVVASGEPQGFTSIPAAETWRCDPGAAYLHYTPNETIGGVEFDWIPDPAVPLVADASSTLLSRPLDVSRFGLIYAGAQKNIGPAGLTVVIVRADLLGQARPDTPTVFDYRVQAEAGSLQNTPCTFAWYLAGLVFQWLKSQGGLSAIERRNRAKAELLYGTIDQSEFYHNPVDPACRSRMNVPFTLANSELDDTFRAEAGKAGLVNLTGHRVIGGMRASLYNAMPIEGVQALVDFMRGFERRYG